MKLKTLVLGLMAALGGCPLLETVTGSEPLCRASDLEPDADLELIPDHTLILTTCEAGRTTTRDAKGRIYRREWTDKTQRDLGSRRRAPEHGLARPLGARP